MNGVPRPMHTQRRDWQLLIVQAKEHAERFFRDCPALVGREEVRATLKAAYVSGFLAGVQQRDPTEGRGQPQ